MRITILLFASYRELAGTGSVALELPPGATAGDAVAALREGRATHSGAGAPGAGDLAGIPPRPALAVNRRHAPADTPLQDGDEVALLPPVAGG
jgi:molybdopterin converting factor small subunit